MNESYWQRDASWRDRWQHVALPGQVDFAVLGGGLAGLATAIRLRELHPGAVIAVLEAERVGYGASGRNAGLLSPLAAPIWLLDVARSADQAWAVNRVHDDMHATARWLAAHLPEAELREATLSVEAGGRFSDCALSEFAAAIAHAGLPHRLEESRVRAGHLVLKMAAYTVHPYKLVRGLAEHAVTAGVLVRERARVRAVELAPGGALLRLDGRPDLRARTVVVCTNAYTSSIELGSLGRPLRAAVVHSFMLASPPLQAAALRGLVRDGDFAVELSSAQAFHRLHGDRLLYGGIDKLLAPRGGDFAVPRGLRARLTKHLHASFPGASGLAATEAWSGRFHATLTGLPILRRSTRTPTVVFNVGYGGTGVALTLGCARLAAALASGDSFATQDDARLYALMQNTRPSVRDALRALFGVVRRLAHPSLPAPAAGPP